MTKLHYFEGISTLEEAKKRYRELAKEHHPDRGGDTETMKTINAQYDFICAKILKGENLNTEEFNEEWEASQTFKNRIFSIINLEGITIEIVGLWIWVTGNTYPVRNELKSAGYFFASKKVAWYWRPEHAAGGRGNSTLEEIKTKYGATVVNANNFTKANFLKS